ncbi:MAG TPA: iron chelate uptake ABC transporter family permease subunit, partial [Candidatus Diapherotrites archaeon]|nr:iron chelate uptake ABC transporter family permease subunit [Candidatus Diapherotrites archaeon]
MGKVKNRNWLVLVFLIASLVLSLIFAASTGAVKISTTEIIEILTKGADTVNASILMDIRLPRVLLAAVLGAGLAAVGGVMQAIFKNPLVDSYTL